MPISITGKLRVKRINGANGPFCVGDLETELGDFRIKDAVLDQFDEGLYEGRFWIQQIYPWSYTAYGRMVIEIRAKLADLQIDGHARPGVESRDPSEPDPAKEIVPEQARKPEAKSEPAAPEHATDRADEPDAQQGCDSDDSDRTLFGAELLDAVSARHPVKLDPTIDRIQFRLQRDRLKSLGYAFQTASQSWVLRG